MTKTTVARQSMRGHCDHCSTTCVTKGGVPSGHFYSDAACTVTWSDGYCPWCGVADAINRRTEVVPYLPEGQIEVWLDAFDEAFAIVRGEK